MYGKPGGCDKHYVDDISRHLSVGIKEDEDYIKRRRRETVKLFNGITQIYWKRNVTPKKEN